jgi:uncharacterized protein with von Willebrand factor type A (vWA) domain
MLSDWFGSLMSQVVERKSELSFSTYKKHHSKSSIQKALMDFVEGNPIVRKEGDESLSWTGEETEDPLGYGGKKGEEEEESSREHINSDMEGNYREIGGGSGDTRELENRFFSNVPPSLIELARKIGRSGSLNGEPSGRFMTASKSDIAGVTTGNDLNCMLPSELALMAGKETENIFFKNYVTRSLQLFSSVSHGGKGKKHHEGPIIICLDTSSSMWGEPIIVAKAITFAICIIAQRKKRKVTIVKYSDTHEAFFLKNLGAQRRELMDFLSESEVGGNNENALFHWLFTELLPTQGDYNFGDILCVSDFGWMPINEGTMELIKAEKEKNMIFYGLNIRNEESYDFLHSPITMTGNCEEEEWGTPETVCDSLWEYSDGKCKEVTKKEL